MMGMLVRVSRMTEGLYLCTSHAMGLAFGIETRWQYSHLTGVYTDIYTAWICLMYGFIWLTSLPFFVAFVFFVTLAWCV